MRGGLAQVVHPCDGLLPAITALVQVDGSVAGIADPAHFVRDGALVGIDAEARRAALRPGRAP